MPSCSQGVAHSLGCIASCCLLRLLLLLQVIRRVDPPSEGVEFARTQSISIDFSGHDVVAHFGGVEEVRRRLQCSRSLTSHSCYSTKVCSHSTIGLLRSQPS